MRLVREEIHVYLWLLRAMGQKKHNIVKQFLQTINAGEDVEKREPSYTVGKKANLCGHYGEQYGGSLEN